MPTAPSTGQLLNFPATRDKCDVQALGDLVSEPAARRDFVEKLHGAADKVRNEQPMRGKPPKVTTAATELKTIMQFNGAASATAV